MFAQFDEREVEYHYVPWKHTEFDTCTRFMVQSILCRTFSCFKILMFQNLVLNMYEDDEFSRQMPGKKDYVSVAKRVHKQKLLALCNLEKCMLPSRKNILMLSLDFPNFAHFDQSAVSLLCLQVLILYVYAVSIKMQLCWLMQ